jgi:hypothetical protein
MLLYCNQRWCQRCLRPGVIDTNHGPLEEPVGVRGGVGNVPVEIDDHQAPLMNQAPQTCQSAQDVGSHCQLKWRVGVAFLMVRGLGFDLLQCELYGFKNI